MVFERLVDQQVEGAGFLGEPEGNRTLSLWIEINDQAAAAALGDQSGQIQGRGGFSNATFAVCYSYDFHFLPSLE